MIQCDYKPWGGVWMDQLGAIVVLPQGEKACSHFIQADNVQMADDFHDPSDTSTRTKQLQNSPKEPRQRDYFERIASRLQGVANLLVMGPDAAPQEFAGHFMQNPRHQTVKVALLKVREMRVPELRIKVQQHFERADGLYFPAGQGPILS